MRSRSRGHVARLLPVGVRPPHYTSRVKNRVVVFLDWQNVYKGARESFHGMNDPSTDGQIDPVRLGRRIAQLVPDGSLQQVRVYRGLPSSTKDPKGYGAARRQTSAWMKADPNHVYVCLHPLQYLDGMAPREKGVDVQLAIDFVTLGVANKFDVGVLFSTDTDLRPALDAVFELNGKNQPWPRVAGWRGPNHRPRRIGASGKREVPCVWLDQVSYLAVRDTTRYAT